LGFSLLKEFVSFIILPIAYTCFEHEVAVTIIGRKESVVDGFDDFFLA
jgi:hypothetical protein